MHQSLPNIIIIILFVISLGNCQSVISKTHDYGNLQFNTSPDGVTYPQYINVVDNLNGNISLYFYNFTNQQLKFPPINFNKGFNSTCDFGLAILDYGYYAKFPTYVVVGECSNSSHTQVFNIKVYRSGDVVVTPGSIIAKIGEESKCNAGPLRVQYFYSASGFSDTFLYRFCQKKQASSLSLYKQYIVGAKVPYVFKQDSIQKLVGLTNINLIDIQPAVGPNGKANLYLTGGYGVIVNSGNKLTQLVWNIPGREKPYRVQRLCWSNKFAVLTEGYIYFIQVIFNSTQATSINLLRKTDKINLSTTANCNFLTIGHNAICSIYDSQNNVTTWYIYGQNTNKIKTNVTQVIKGKNFKPYISEDLCATNSFYQGNSRYQLNFNNLQLNSKSQISLFSQMKNLKRQLTAQYGIQNFIDLGSIFFAVYFQNISNGTIQQVTIANYDKIRNQMVGIQSFNITKNATLKLQYQSLSSTNKYLYVIITQSLNKNLTTINQYRQLTYAPYIQKVSTTPIPVIISQIGYLKNYGTSQIYFVPKTTIQKNTYARLILNSGNYELRYGYQIQSQGFKVCSIYGADDQIIYYRQDSNALVVMKVGFRLKTALVLDDVLSLSQYRGFTTKCYHDGLFLYNINTQQIYTLDSDLQIRSSLSLPFESIAYTRTLVLLKNNGFVQVRTQSKGDLLGIYKWNIQDLVTNIHSNGFFNVKQGMYYQFGNQKNIRSQ